MKLRVVTKVSVTVLDRFTGRPDYIAKQLLDPANSCDRPQLAHERAEPVTSHRREVTERGLVSLLTVRRQTLRSFVTRPTSTHSTTKMFPS